MIVRNSAKCLLCLDEIESVYRHDYVTCSCGAVAVDGGKAHLRRSLTDPAAYQDTSILAEETPR